MKAFSDVALLDKVFVDLAFALVRHIDNVVAYLASKLFMHGLRTKLLVLACGERRTHCTEKAVAIAINWYESGSIFKVLSQEISYIAWVSEPFSQVGLLLVRHPCVVWVWSVVNILNLDG